MLISLHDLSQLRASYVCRCKIRSLLLPKSKFPMLWSYNSTIKSLFLRFAWEARSILTEFRVSANLRFIVFSIVARLWKFLWKGSERFEYQVKDPLNATRTSSTRSSSSPTNLCTFVSKPVSSIIWFTTASMLVTRIDLWMKPVPGGSMVEPPTATAPGSLTGWSIARAFLLHDLKMLLPNAGRTLSFSLSNWASWPIALI